MAAAPCAKEPECSMIERERCHGGAPKRDSAGRNFFFMERTMTFETVEAISSTQDPGNMLCQAC